MFPARTAFTVVAAIAGAVSTSSADWPEWGGGPTRNPVRVENGLPLDFRFEETDDTGKVVKAARGITWKVSPGERIVVTPLVADGLVWVCTNAREPADDTIPSKDWDGGVLACLREADGKELWRNRTPRRTDGWGMDFSRAALGSAPLVEGPSCGTSTTGPRWCAWTSGR